MTSHIDPQKTRRRSPTADASAFHCQGADQYFSLKKRRAVPFPQIGNRVPSSPCPSRLAKLSA